jgi:hypothetical protein
MGNKLKLLTTVSKSVSLDSSTRREFNNPLMSWVDQSLNLPMNLPPLPDVRNEKRKKTPEELEKEKHDKKLEDEHFATVVTGFTNYERFTFRNLHLVQKNWKTLSNKYKQLLPEYQKSFDFLKAAIVANYNFILQIIAPYRTYKEKHEEDVCCFHPIRN